jgi:hypothetical protein
VSGLRKTLPEQDFTCSRIPRRKWHRISTEMAVFYAKKPRFGLFLRRKLGVFEGVCVY